MKKNLIIGIIIIVVVLIGVLLVVKNQAEYNNPLSSSDTFDRFIILVEKGEYEEAKKLTTDDFNGDYSLIRKIGISKKTPDKDLSSSTKYVYLDEEEIGYYKTITRYSFELINTTNGWKLNNYTWDVSSNEDELNSLIY